MGDIKALVGTNETIPKEYPRSKLGLQILRADIAKLNKQIVLVAVNFRDIAHTLTRLPLKAESTSHFDSITEGNVTNLESPDSNYRELFDSAALIVSKILKQPKLIINAIACVHSDANTSAKIGVIEMNRILHPYFSDTSATTVLLLEGIKYQIDLFKPDNKDFREQTIETSSLFVENSSVISTWNSLYQPLPVTPNIQSEKVLTTLLKIYAVRVDVTRFFRELWIPVLPSIVAVITNRERDSSSHLKSLTKVAMRLLCHTFSEKSLISFPPTATAVGKAIFNISGKNGLCTYLFDLLMLPNLIKILSLADYDSVGGDVMIQYYACYSLDNWWPNSGDNRDPLRLLIYITWKLFSRSGIDSLDLTTLSSKQFFNEPFLDPSDISDHRLRYNLSTLQHVLNKSCHMLINLPLDLKGCELLNVNAISTTKDLKTAYPALTKDLDERLNSLLPKPKVTLVIKYFTCFVVYFFHY